MALSTQSANVFRKKSLLSFTNPFSKVTEQYKSTRTNLYFLMKNTGSKILLVSSPNKGEGKTTTIVNLAISMIKGNEKVLLIDANFRNPCIHSIFQMENNAGFLDVLKGVSSFEQAVSSTSIKNLEVLTTGDLSPSSLEVIDSRTVSSFFEDIMQKYDRIVIDSPPLLEAAEARFLASRSDGVILVANRYVTKLEDFAKAKRALEVANANLLGVVLNERNRSKLENSFFS